jgi:hypothetical protein
MMGMNEKLIGLELSWDGANPFNNGTKEMWPVFVSILNFPSTLRNQMHSGMHLIAVDDGSQSVWDAIVKELIDLWNNGIKFNEITYKVAVLRVVLDGRGLEKLTRTSGQYFLLFPST